jgi:hypothetical protein
MIFLCVYVILVSSEQNLHVPYLKTVGWDIDYYHRKLYSIQKYGRLLLHSYFYNMEDLHLQIPPGGKPIEMRYDSCIFQLVFLTLCLEIRITCLYYLSSLVL